MQQSIGDSSSMRGETEFQFEWEILLYRKLQEVERVELNSIGSAQMLCQVTANIRLVDIDGRKLSKPDYIFGDAVHLQDALDVEVIPWYDETPSQDRVSLLFVLFQALYRGVGDRMESHTESRFSHS